MKEIKKYINAREADVYNMPIHERIDWLINLSKRHSEVYCTPEAYLARKRYTFKHPTMVIVLKCMDGRIHIPYATKTPLGIIKPFRNFGGMFDLGWPYLGEVLYNTVNQAIESSQRVLLLITYHFSKSEKKRGCAGFDHDCEKAKNHVAEIKKQIEYIFGFDFLHIPNMALIIGPYSPDLSGPIVSAVGVIKSNMNNGMIPKDGFLLLVSAPYREIGVDKARAELKSTFLSQYASDVIIKEHPNMQKLMIKKTAVLNWNTRNLEITEIRV